MTSLNGLTMVFRNEICWEQIENTVIYVFICF